MLVTIRQIEGNPAREIAEGRGPRRRLRCIPLQTNLPVPRATIAYEDTLAIRHTGVTKYRNSTHVLKAFRESKPGEFTIESYAAFAETQGYSGSHHALQSHIYRMASEGTLKRVDPPRTHNARFTFPKP